MPNWIHRTTKQVLNSVPSAELPEAKANYIEEPVLPDTPSKYWVVSGDAVSLMDKAARDVVDAAEKAVRDTAEIDSYDNPLVRTLLEKINTLETNAEIRNTTFDEIKTDAKAKL